MVGIRIGLGLGLVYAAIALLGCSGGGGEMTRNAGNATMSGGSSSSGGKSASTGGAGGNAIMSSGGGVSTGGMDPAGNTGGDGGSCTTAGCPGVDECASADLNNCGAATCVDMDQGFECVCDAGLIFKNGVCGCDLAGTYAVKTIAPLSWPASKAALDTIIEAGMEDTTGFGLLTITQLGDGWVGESRGCGGENPDLCSPYYGEAFGQSFPESIWDLPSMPAANLGFNITGGAPGETFTTTQSAAFLGFRFADGVDPFGAFPASATDPSLVWVDDDSDGNPGLTSNVTPPGGTSARCNMPYGYFPVDALVASAVAKTFYVGARTISHIEGTIVDCNTLTGQVLTDSANGRVYGCVRDDGSACSATQAKFVDSNSGGQTIGPAAFSMVKLTSASPVCADARSATYP